MNIYIYILYNMCRCCVLYIFILGCKRFIKVEADGQSYVYNMRMVYCEVHEVITIIFILSSSVDTNKLLNVEFLHKLNRYVYNITAVRILRMAFIVETDAEEYPEF